MNVRELRTMLERNIGALSDIERLELQELTSKLASFDDLSLASFVELLAGIKLKKSARRTTSKVPATVNELVVTRYFAELNQAKDDNQTFEAVIKRASKDKSIKAAEANLLAHRFLGESKKFKSKADAFKAVLERQILDKRSKSRVSQVSDLF